MLWSFKALAAKETNVACFNPQKCLYSFWQEPAICKQNGFSQKKFCFSNFSAEHKHRHAIAPNILPSQGLFLVHLANLRPLPGWLQSADSDPALMAPSWLGGRERPTWKALATVARNPQRRAKFIAKVRVLKRGFSNK
jgi:hypothetical protein